MAGALSGTDRPAEGYRIGRSFQNKARGFLCCLVMIPLGGAIVWAWWTELTFAGHQLNVAGGLLGALAFGFGLLMTPLSMPMLFKRRDMILGADRLQILGNEENVVTQVPYKNISRIGLVKTRYGKFIAFEYFDPQDPNTLNAVGGDEAKSIGWHSLLIGDSWSVPLEHIYARLNAVLQVQSANDPAGQARLEHSAPGSANDEITGSLGRERQT